MSCDGSRPRPNIPPVLTFALALWAGSAVLWKPAFEMTPLSSGILLAVLIAVIIVIRLLLPSKKLVLLLSISFSLGCLLSLVTAHGIMAQREYLHLDPQTTATEFFVLEDERESEFGSSCLALALRGQSHPMKVRVYLDQEQDLRFGQRFSGTCAIESPSDASTDVFNTKGIIGTCSLSQVIRQDSKSMIAWIADVRKESVTRLSEAASKASFAEDAGIFLCAVLFADRGELYDCKLYQDVRVCGLAHLVAVSGAHLVIICGFVSSLLDALRVGKRASLVIQLLFLGGYLVMVGLPPSCMRAAVMAVCAHMSSFSLRRPSALNALGIALIIFIVLDPSLAVSLSLALSTLATLGILVLMPLFSNWIDALPRQLPDLLAEPLAMTLAATLTTLPLSCASFSQLPLIGPLANIVATPILSMVCMLGVVGFFLQPVIQISDLVFTLDLFASGLFCWMCSSIAALPFACIPISAEGLYLEVGSALALASLWWFWPRLSRKLIGLLVAISLSAVTMLGFAFSNTGTYLRMIDVGQGDAILLQSEGHSVLVDTGNQPAKLLSGLSRAGTNHIDAVLITHADDDHCGSLSDMRNIIEVEEVILAKGTDGVGSDKTEDLIARSCELTGDAEPTYVSSGAHLSFGCWSCQVLWPRSLGDEGGNADSICLLASCDIDSDGTPDCKAFLCGDTESEVLQELIDSNELGDIDIYKVGHHGSRDAISTEQAAILKPEVALVSVGANNRYGHPTSQVLSTLEQCGADVYRTDISGDVVCSFTPSKIRVSTMR